MPRSWATCAIGRFDSKTRRTARSRSSSGYFLGLAIAGASPSARTEPGIGASKFPRVLQNLNADNVRLYGLRLQGPHMGVADDAENLEEAIEIDSCVGVEI